MAIVMASTSGKRVLLMTPLSLWNRNETQGARSGEYGGCSSTAMIYWQDIPGWSMHCVPEHCRGEAAMIFFRAFVTSSLALTASNAAGRPCKCAGWWSGPVTRILHVQCPSSKKQSTSPWFWTWPSSLSLALVTSESSTEGPGAWSLDRIQRSMICRLWLLSPASSVWFRLFQDVMAHLHMPLFQQLRNRFCTDPPHHQIFHNDCPHALTVHVQLIYNHSNSQVAISMHLLADNIIFLSPACGRPLALGVIFHILPSLLKPPGPLQSVSSRHLCHPHRHPAVIWVLLLEFFQAKQVISSWFVARWSLCYRKNAGLNFS